MTSFTIETKNDLFGGQFNYSNGHSIGVLAEQTVVEKTLVLNNVVFYPINTSGNELKNEFKTEGMFETLKALKDYARSKGYNKLTLKYQRAPNSSSKTPGHTVEKTFDLTNDKNGN